MTETNKVHDTAVIRKALTKVTKAKRESLMAMQKENFGERKRLQKKKQNDSKSLRS